MSSFDFSQWPPKFTDIQLTNLVQHATTYALAHGLAYLPAIPSQPPAPSSVTHAPISLLPAPVPRALFRKAQRLQSIYNDLYARVATDDDFLDQVMGAEVGVGQADEFVRRLWKGWKEIREEGIVQPLHLGLFRSDYLLHTGDGHALGLKQVEFNTISSSFGPLSEKVSAMHRYLYALTNYYHGSPHLKPENFPPNDTISGLVNGLAEAHKAYGVPSAYILFVVQPDERNVFDQRWLEYELLEKHGIRVVHRTFLELATTTSLSGPSRTLLLTVPSNSIPIEISTIYFRAGYAPTDLPTETHWTVRLTLERSHAIKCPSIPLQLAGGKKVQETLSQPGVVERFFTTLESSVAASATAELRETWMPMWALDAENLPTLPTSFPDVERNPGEPLGTTFARRHAENLVLKPQREGGGNNVYKGNIPAFLEALPAEERMAWIAMALIVPPAGIGSYLARAVSGAGGAGQNKEDEERPKLVCVETISELGIFGWALFGKDEGTGVVRKERGDVGWLMRTKGVESDEGGVAAGFSVLDSVVLVDG
ncbi:glutathione synthase [Boletus reticuloceps]|uniref:Glutathione synthetase n=1 Tax=Boletus reticuloceps TaxID=495285 RepID=A0A8I3AEG5_9AGAM|nr:glutathione synthase [Boletus reticuloceps]